MPRIRKINDLAFFLNNRLEIQYCPKCLDCRKDCKQSFRAEIVRCLRHEPISTNMRRKAVA